MPLTAPVIEPLGQLLEVTVADRTLERLWLTLPESEASRVAVARRFVEVRRTDAETLAEPVSVLLADGERDTSDVGVTTTLRVSVDVDESTGDDELDELCVITAVNDAVAQRDAADELLADRLMLGLLLLEALRAAVALVDGLLREEKVPEPDSMADAEALTVSDGRFVELAVWEDEALDETEELIETVPVAQTDGVAAAVPELVLEGNNIDSVAVVLTVADCSAEVLIDVVIVCVPETNAVTESSGDSEAELDVEKNSVTDAAVDADFQGL